MAQYKVVVLGVQGINNKVYGPGDIVTEKNFPEGNAEKLVEERKLEAVTKSDKKAEDERKVAELKVEASNKEASEAEDQKEKVNKAKTR